MNKINNKYKISRVICSLFLFYLGIIALNCTNPFSTRKAAIPEQNFNNSQLLTMQLEPDSLIKKMEMAFSLQNKTYYNELFTPNSIDGENLFTFLPQEINNTGYFDNWGIIEEQKYFSDIVDNTGLLSLSLKLNRNPAEPDWTPVNIGSTDSLRCSFYYDIKINISGNIKYYSGEAKFEIAKEQYYTIYFWQDLAITNLDSTWSTLKRNPLSDE